VIAQSGAAIANIIYMQPGSTLIELRYSGAGVEWCWEVISKEFDIQYIPLYVKKGDLHGDIEVSVETLNNVLTNTYQIAGL